MAGERNLVGSLPGLEAVHAIGAVKLHDPQGPLPRLKCSRIAGLRAMGDTALVTDARTGWHGEIPRPTFRTGKTVTYEGLTQADTLERLRWHEGVVGQALFQTTELRVDITPDPAYGGNSYFYLGRAVQWEPVEEQTFPPNATPSPWQRTFNLAIRLSKPFVFLSVLRTIDSGFAGGGGAVGLDVNNDGLAPVEPIVKMVGPLVGPRFTLGGLVLAFRSTVVIPAGQTWQFDFATRRTTRMDNGQVQVAVIDPALSTWLDGGVDALPVGVSHVVMSQAAGNPGAGSQFGFLFHPAIGA